jgi:diguanylate cyclase (GGDEF)-like protein
MAMFRQLLLLIIFSSILGLISSVVISTLNTRSYLVQELSVKNQDNASALALSLSQSVGDPVQEKLIVAAQFDHGNYKLVRFADPLGKIILEKTSADLVTGAPSWFVSILPIVAHQGYAQVSHGWVQLGAVTLESDSAYAYRSLWKSMLKMTLGMAIVLSITCYLGFLFLAKIKRPLDQVVAQALAISQKRFITIPEPRIPELKQLATAMNLMAKRVQGIFDEEAKLLALLRHEVNYDKLTGLPSRNAFVRRLGRALSDDVTSACLILRIANLADINRTDGRAVADDIIRRVAQQVQLHSEKMQDPLCGRLNGSDFALVLADEDPLTIANALISDVVAQVGQYYVDGACVSVGIAKFSPGLTLSALMSKIDMALAAAETAGDNLALLADSFDDSTSPDTLERWSVTIKKAINLGYTNLLYFPVTDFDGNILHREGHLQIREAEDSAWIPAAKFLPLAERLGLSDSLDLTAVALALQTLASDKLLPAYAINICASSLKVNTFIPALKKLIQAHAPDAKRLCLELSEYDVFKTYEEFKVLSAMLQGTGVQLGIAHFGRKFDQVSLLHTLGMNYIKVDASLIRGIESDLGNQAFLEGLVAVARGIGLLVIAEGALTEAESHALQFLTFNGLIGPAIKV